MADVLRGPFAIEVPVPGESSVAKSARDARDVAVAAKDTAVSSASTATNASATAVSARDTAVSARDTAVSARDTAVSARDTAVSSASTASTAATTATTQATTATTQAGIATTQADIATTQATAAQQSASAAAASVPATADRTVGRRPSDTAIWSMIRATPAWGFGPDGNFSETPVDTLRWEFDMTTLAPLGAAFAGARGNAFTNPRFEGATPGVLGSGGVMPTGYGVFGSGIATEVIGVGTWRGAPALTLRFTSASAPSFFVLSMPGGPTTVIGDNVITSYWGFVVAGSLAGITSSRVGNTAGGTSSLTTPQISATPNRLTNVRVATSTSIGSGLRFDCTLGAAIDVTITFALPQIENGGTANFASAPILPAVGSLTASTRAQGSVTIPVQQLGARLSRRQGLILIDWNSQPGPFTSAADADWFGLVSWGDTTADNRMGLLVNPAHSSIQARCTAGGVVQAASAVTITAPAAGLTTRAALAWDLDAGFMQVAARGAAGTKVALTAAPAVLSNLMLGRYATSNPGFVRIQGFDCRPAAVFDATLAALT